MTFAAFRPGFGRSNRCIPIEEDSSGIDLIAEERGHHLVEAPIRDDRVSERLACLLVRTLAVTDLLHQLAMLRFHALHQAVLGEAARRDQIGVRSLTRRDDLAARVDQGLDDRVVQPAIFRLHVIGAAAELDIRIESGNHLVKGN